MKKKIDKRFRWQLYAANGGLHMAQAQLRRVMYGTVASEKTKKLAYEIFSDLEVLKASFGKDIKDFLGEKDE